MGENEGNIMVNKKSIPTNQLKSSGKQSKITPTHRLELECLNFETTLPQIESLKAIIFNAKEKNHLKIEFIKEALSTGRYEIHNDHIATKLMAFVATEEALESV